MPVLAAGPNALACEGVILTGMRAVSELAGVVGTTAGCGALLGPASCMSTFITDRKVPPGGPAPGPGWLPPGRGCDRQAEASLALISHMVLHWPAAVLEAAWGWEGPVVVGDEDCLLRLSGAVCCCCGL